MKKILADVKYRDLVDLIFILSEPASEYFNLNVEDGMELTLGQFTEWLCMLKGSVQLSEENPK